jgi:hypothetical protein
MIAVNGTNANIKTISLNCLPTRYIIASNKKNKHKTS